MLMLMYVLYSCTQVYLNASLHCAHANVCAVLCSDMQCSAVNHYAMYVLCTRTQRVWECKSKNAATLRQPTMQLTLWWGRLHLDEGEVKLCHCVTCLELAGPVVYWGGLFCLFLCLVVCLFVCRVLKSTLSLRDLLRIGSPVVYWGVLSYFFYLFDTIWLFAEYQN